MNSPMIKRNLSKSFIVLSLTALFLLFSGNAFSENIKRKGRFIRTETEKVDERISFMVTLSISKETSYPVFKIHRMNLRTIHEVKLFETVVDTINTNHPDGNLRDYRNLLVLPDEFIKDERSTREENVYGGPFKNTPFTIDGIPVVTDDKGLIIDSKQQWLAKFDDLSKNSQTITVEHKTYGKKEIMLTRFILRPTEPIQPEYKSYDKHATMDVLEALGLDFSIASNTTSAPVDFKCEIPEKCVFGDVFSITIEASNNTDKTCGNLIYCTFSRDSWLDGRLFYIGNLKPGQKRSFTRLFKVPDNLKTDQSNLVISSWDTNKAHPEAARHFLIKTPH